MARNIVGWKTLTKSGELNFAYHEFKLERDALAVVEILRAHVGSDMTVHAFATHMEFNDWARGHAFEFVESALRTRELTSMTGQKGLAVILKKTLQKMQRRR